MDGRRRMDTETLRDDGERIVVYARHGAMRRHALVMAGLAVLCVVAAGSPFILPPDPLEPVDWHGSVAIFGPIACLFALLALVSFARSLQRGPALIVSADGIVDRSASVMGGKRALSWKEIAWVGYEIRPGPGGIQQFLVINLFQFPTASAHTPMTETPSPKAPYPFTTTVLRIGEDALVTPIAELASEIERYIKVHVPPGWHGELSSEGRDHVLIADPPDAPGVW